MAATCQRQIMPSNFQKLENEFWRIMHTRWGGGRSAEAKQGSAHQKVADPKQTPCDHDGDISVQCKHATADEHLLDAETSADGGDTSSVDVDTTSSTAAEAIIAICSQGSTQDHSDTNSVLSCDSFCSSCSTANSVGVAPSWGSESSDSVDSVTGFAHADVSSNFGHRPFAAVSEYSWPQFAADQVNCSTFVEEGWDGFVIWPRKIPRAIIQRETPSLIARQGERSGTTLSL